jgi:hypothetical protein
VPEPAFEGIGKTFEPGAPHARLTIKAREMVMSEQRIAQLFGLVLGGVFTFGLVLNALAY